jgi:ribonuclease BN (tRNA processing enzyme)
MKIKVLGCSGGIGANLRTTSFLINDEVLIDAGTGVSEMDLDDMRKIRAVFLSHSHMDHIAGLPLLVDTIFEVLNGKPLTVYATHATLTALREHVFNNVIWPDFTHIPTADAPVLVFQEMAPGQPVTLGDATVEMIPVNHVVPTVGFRVESSAGRSFAFTGDSTTNDTFWEGLNRFASLDLLVAEVAFPNSEQWLCELAYHYCPKLLAADIGKLQHQPQLYISHLKPGSETAIMQELSEQVQGFEVRQLSGGDIFQL